MKKPIIDLKSVWKTYKMGDVKVHALRGLDFSVSEGEFVAIMGPSGSGKSTAMNIIGCLDVPSEGVVKLDGTNIVNFAESDLAQIRGKKIGFIFQKFNLIPTMTALENVMLPMGFQDVSLEKRREKATALLEMVDLGERIHHKPNELSGGQQQRVAIARSLAMDPPVILADEPTGNLDSKMGVLIIDFLQKLHGQGRTIVMVTHDEHVAEFAERIEFLSDGKIIKSTKGKKFKSKYEEKK